MSNSIPVRSAGLPESVKQVGRADLSQAEAFDGLSCSCALGKEHTRIAGQHCRGIFLDYGELEALPRMEGQWNQPAAPPPPAYPQQPHTPAWGAPHHGHHGHHKHRSFTHMLFSS